MKNSLADPATTRPAKAHRIEIERGENPEPLDFSIELKALLERSDKPTATSQDAEQGDTASRSLRPYAHD